MGSAMKAVSSKSCTRAMGATKATHGRAHTRNNGRGVARASLATGRRNVFSSSSRSFSPSHTFMTTTTLISTISTRSTTTTSTVSVSPCASSSSSERLTAKEWIENWRGQSTGGKEGSNVSKLVVEDVSSTSMNESVSESSIEKQQENSVETIANEEEGDSDGDSDVGYIPGKELMGLTGGWMFGEVGLKTDDGLEKSMEATLKGWYKNKGGSNTTKKYGGKKEKVASKEPTAAIGKDFGGMAGGWPSGEVGLKEFNKSGDVAAKRSQDANDLSVYLPLAIASAIIVSGFMIFFFGIDVNSLVKSIQGSYSEVARTVEGDGGNSSGGVGALIGGDAPGQLPVRTAGLIVFTLLTIAITTSKLKAGVDSFTSKAGDSLKIGFLMVFAAAIAYKIIIE